MTERIKNFKEAFSSNSNPFYTARYVAFFAAIIGFFAILWTYFNGLVLAYNDAGLHLDVARRIYDSRDPGILNQIGVVWLPVPHIILIPFVHFDLLWITGLAGSIVGWFCYIFSVSFLYRIIRYITEENISALMGTAFFALNPNILYLYSTPMTEPLLLMLIIIGVYHILNWLRNGISGELVRSGIALGLACLTRYEAWTFTIIIAVIIFIVAVTQKMKHPLKSFIYFSMVPALCIIWYLFINYYFYNDIFAFQKGPYSSEYHVAMKYASIGGPPYLHNTSACFDILNKTLVANTGIVMLILGIIGLIIYLYNKKLSAICLIPVALLIFYPMNFISLYAGQVAIEMPNTIPKGYFQTRYVIAILPGLSIFVGYLFFILKNLNYRIIAFSFLIFLEFLSWFFVWPMGVPTIGEAKTAIALSQPFRRTSNYLKNFYDGGNILYDDFSIIFFSGNGLPIKERIHEYSWDLGETALKNPSSVTKWVMFNKTNPNDKIYQAMKSNEDFHNHFNIVYYDEGIEVYKRKF
ncbi:MAG: glycosyltransferase family 39 protein [Ignavibacteria bacterium]|nr:glycosyltransferase family 39 protein [Ignavibacteria bacterium]